MYRNWTQRASAVLWTWHSAELDRVALGAVPFDQVVVFATRYTTIWEYLWRRARRPH